MLNKKNTSINGIKINYVSRSWGILLIYYNWTEFLNHVLSHLGEFHSETSRLIVSLSLMRTNHFQNDHLASEPSVLLCKLLFSYFFSPQNDYIRHISHIVTLISDYYSVFTSSLHRFLHFPHEWQRGSFLLQQLHYIYFF